MAYAEFHMCNLSTSALSFNTLAISCAAVLMLAVILSMAGKITGNKRMELWSGNMLYDIVITFLIAGAIIVLYSAFGNTAPYNVGSLWVPSMANTTVSSSVTYFDGTQCVYGNAMSYLAAATKYTINVAKLAIWANGNMENLISATKTEPTLTMGFGYYTSTLAQQPVYPSIVKVKGMLGSVMSIAIMSALTADTAQMFLLKMVLSPIMFSLLAFAVILRPLPVFKYFANSVIAVLISFMLVFPVMVTLEGLVFKVPDASTVYDSTDFDDEAKGMIFGNNWQDLLSQALLNGLLGGNSVMMDWHMDPNGSGLKVVCEGLLCPHMVCRGITCTSVLIDVYGLLEDVYNAFFISAFILSINSISIAAGSKAISTLMDEEESLMEMFIKVI
jgi:hypothetical protein